MMCDAVCMRSWLVRRVLTFKDEVMCLTWRAEHCDQSQHTVEGCGGFQSNSAVCEFYACCDLQAALPPPRADQHVHRRDSLHATFESRHALEIMYTEASVKGLEQDDLWDLASVAMP